MEVEPVAGDLQRPHRGKWEGGWGSGTGDACAAEHWCRSAGGRRIRGGKGGGGVRSVGALSTCPRACLYLGILRDATIAMVPLPFVMVFQLQPPTLKRAMFRLSPGTARPFTVVYLLVHTRSATSSLGPRPCEGDAAVGPLVCVAGTARVRGVPATRAPNTTLPH